MRSMHMLCPAAALASLCLFTGLTAHAAVISNGNLNTVVGQYANTVGTTQYSLNTTTGNVVANGSSDTGRDANEWLWTAITRGFNYDENGGSGGAGDGAFVPNTAGSSIQNHRAVLQFADDGKTTVGLQAISMDVFMDDNTVSNALTFRVELYAWNGSPSPSLSVGGSTSAYNVTTLNGATTILDTTVPATGVTDATWETVNLGTVNLGSGYDYYAWRIGVLGQTDTDVFKFDNVTVVPEPSSVLLAGLCGAGMLLVRRRTA